MRRRETEGPPVRASLCGARTALAIKYIILLVLFGISLESMQMAEQAAEVEPFKTAIILGFDRQWWFVLYAALLLVINLFTRKVYCRLHLPAGPPSHADASGFKGQSEAYNRIDWSFGV